jgi:NAD(P)-dependent dehydrogenase (short-subunit alcohol dehydrogenase family)
MKNIIITVASSGFGSLASHALALAGHTVYAGMRETTGRNAAQVEDANRFSKEYGVDLRTVEMDVSNSPLWMPPSRPLSSSKAVSTC